jgi:Tol biopolymer transport system component
VFLRTVGGFDTRALTEGDSNVQNLTFSPDGQWIAFRNQADNSLKRVNVSGGAPETLLQETGNFYDLAWRGSHIYGANGNSVVRVPERGGEKEQILKADENEFFGGVDVLPNGTFLIASARVQSVGGNPTTGFDEAQIFAYPPGGSRRVLVQGGTFPRYIDSTGHLVFLRQGVAYAVPFDSETLELKGTPRQVITGVQRGQAAAQLSVSAAGTLVYLPGPATGGAGPWEPALFADEQPEGVPLKMTPGPFEHVRASPNGRFAALQTSQEQTSTVWIYDLTHTTTPRRLTFKGHARYPVWTPDNQRVVYQWNGEGDEGLFWQRADGSDQPERLTRADAGASHMPHSWSPDGSRLLFDIAKDRRSVLHMFALSDRRISAVPHVEPSIVHTGAELSPDGRWLAYAIRQLQGRSTIFVQPYPPTGAKYQVSDSPGEDGHHVMWSRDGSQLIYNPGPGQTLKLLKVRGAASFSTVEPTNLAVRFRREAPVAPRPYDILPDGRILALRAPAGGLDAAGMIVFLNWTEELKRLMPTR